MLTRKVAHLACWQSGKRFCHVGFLKGVRNRGASNCQDQAAHGGSRKCHLPSSRSLLQLNFYFQPGRSSGCCGTGIKDHAQRAFFITAGPQESHFPSSVWQIGLICQCGDFVGLLVSDNPSPSSGVVHWSPPESALQRAAEAVREKAASSYGPCEGLPELVAALEAKVAAENSLPDVRPLLKQISV